jgi:riboflavin kinase/FMN adenylyltransferase
VEEGERERKLEVHLLDFDNDIYGQELEVRFVERLRDEIKLPDLDALKAQIAKDSAKARKALGVELCEVELEEE